MLTSDRQGACRQGAKRRADKRSAKRGACVAEPCVALPSRNSTTPVGGMTPFEELTVAVKVTNCPNVDGFGAELSVVVVDALVTSWFSDADVLVMNCASPL